MQTLFKDMIEIVTTNGYRRLIKYDLIATISELSEGKEYSSRTMILLRNGEKIFVNESYDEIVKIIKELKESLED